MWRAEGDMGSLENIGWMDAWSKKKHDKLRGHREKYRGHRFVLRQTFC